MDMDEVEAALESFLGDQGKDGIVKMKTMLESGYHVLDKARKALDSASELTDAVAHARGKMKEGYEQTKEFISPGMLQNFKAAYALLKKFGIIRALEEMSKK